MGRVVTNPPKMRRQLNRGGFAKAIAKMTPEQKAIFDKLSDSEKEVFIKSAGLDGMSASTGMAIGAGAQLAGQVVNTIDQQDGEASMGGTIASNALQYGGKGAAIGTMIAPGVGTAIGGGIGAVAGAAVGYMQGKGQQDQQSQADKAARHAAGASSMDVAGRIGAKEGGKIGSPSGLVDIIMGPQSPTGTALINDGREKKASGGSVVGPGGPKADAIDTQLPKGSFVVPAENAAIAEQLRSTYFSTPKKKMKGGGSVPVSLSNGEHVFMPEEVSHLEKQGINLHYLAPNAEQTGMGYQNGGRVKMNHGGKAGENAEVASEKELEEIEALLDDPNVQAYLEGIRHGEEDPKKGIKSKNPNSTAQGSFQFLQKTRDEILEKYGYDAWSKEPTMQALAAVALIYDNNKWKKKGEDGKVLDHIKSGNFDKADKILAERKQWTSLPGGAEKNSKTDAIPQVREEYLKSRESGNVAEYQRKYDPTKRFQYLVSEDESDPVDFSIAEDPLKAESWLNLKEAGFFGSYRVGNRYVNDSAGPIHPFPEYQNVDYKVVQEINNLILGAKTPSELKKILSETIIEKYPNTLIPIYPGSKDTRAEYHIINVNSILAKAELLRQRLENEKKTISATSGIIKGDRFKEIESELKVLSEINRDAIYLRDTHRNSQDNEYLEARYQSGDNLPSVYEVTGTTSSASTSKDDETLPKGLAASIDERVSRAGAQPRDESSSNDAFTTKTKSNSVNAELTQSILAATNPEELKRIVKERNSDFDANAVKALKSKIELLWPRRNRLPGDSVMTASDYNSLLQSANNIQNRINKVPPSITNLDDENLPEGLAASIDERVSRAWAQPRKTTYTERERSRRMDANAEEIKASQKREKLSQLAVNKAAGVPVSLDGLSKEDLDYIDQLTAKLQEKENAAKATADAEFEAQQKFDKKRAEDNDRMNEMGLDEDYRAPITGLNPEKPILREKPSTEIPEIPPPSEEQNRINVLQSLGGLHGLLAIGQTAVGLAGVLDRKGDPGDFTPDPTLTRLRDEAILDSNRMDPAIKAAAETNMELTRRATNETIQQQAGGDTGLALSNMNRSAIAKNRSIVDLAAEQERNRMQKKQYAAGLAEQVATERRFGYEQRRNDFMTNQQAAAGLMNTGIKNLLQGELYRSFNQGISDIEGQEKSYNEKLGQGLKTLFGE